ncbi:hypothetical protein EDC14_102851 [Hydrogenispora ethanolica]|jgi:hypothetical protein|uniref:Uncharacterized protein n=1 Tax=Hydrogenispora ethanolica TaxID=1082276 RepID=A0A4R1R8U2_HYDET|nr:hypothetical protein [Hydrogenispora ethanolica]TCL62094.1 hypothetical protein EDC14_102851 [Hydrogenispora ethanolica]
MKGIFWKEGESFSNSMSLIAFLLVRYPEIGTVRYDPDQKTLQFSFMLIKTLDAGEFEAFKEGMALSLGAISDLQGRKQLQTEISFTECDNLTFLEILRDIDSLSQEEIGLIIGVVHQFFEGNLLLDQEEAVQDEDVLLQEEMIDHMLEDLKDSQQEKRLIGFREEGRVMVFNRANLHK